MSRNRLNSAGTGLVILLTMVSGSAYSGMVHAVIASDQPDESAKATDSSDTPKKRQDRSVMAELKVVLHDADGQPIAGARVMPYAMRVKEQQGHGYWNHETLGPPQEATSNDEGIAVIQYPATIDVVTDLLTTALVTFQIKHTEFVQKVVHFDLGPEQAEVTLDAGCAVQVSAMDEEGKPITDFAILMAGPYATDQWASDGENGKRTRAIKDGKWQTLLVSIPAEGPTLFSSALTLAVRPSQAVRLRKVTLKPGARVHGRLSESVPRPIKHGRIIATAAPKPAGPSYDDKDPSIVWHDAVGIGEDGDFELPSLPRGGEVQIIAICDGWVSKTTIPDAGDFFVMGQLFPLTTAETSITVEMEETGSLEVLVATPSGEPLEGATVATWPNQAMFKGGSTILGAEFASRHEVQAQLNRGKIDQGVRIHDGSANFSGKTDDRGRVILRGIPLKRSQSLAVMHDKYGIAKDEENQERYKRFSLETTTVQTLEVRTSPLGE